MFSRKINVNGLFLFQKKDQKQTSEVCIIQIIDGETYNILEGYSTELSLTNKQWMIFQHVKGELNC